MMNSKELQAFFNSLYMHREGSVLLGNESITIKPIPYEPYDASESIWLISIDKVVIDTSGELAKIAIFSKDAQKAEFEILNRNAGDFCSYFHTNVHANGIQLILKIGKSIEKVDVKL